MLSDDDARGKIEFVLERARKLIDRGFWPIVLHAQGEMLWEGQQATGKEPVGKDWGLAQPTLEGIREKLQEFPGRGLGLRLGPESGILDVEEDGPEGADSLRKLFGGRIPETVSWTSSRGTHRIFHRLDAFDVIGKAVFKLPEYPDLEFRIGRAGSQTQSACPPTMGCDGTMRRWGKCATVAYFPESTINHLATLWKKPPVHPVVPSGPKRSPGDPGLRRYGLKALENHTGTVTASTEGNRNSTLNQAAFSLGTLCQPGVLDRSEAEQGLLAAAQIAGLSPGEAQATIRSGLNAGVQNPASIVPLAPPAQRGGSPPPGQGPPKPPTPPGGAGPGGPPEQGHDGPEYGEELGIWATEVVPREVKWLWPGYVPSETLSVFAGPGGSGKTFLLLDLAARVSAGLEWPEGNGECATPGNVIYISGEDDCERTLVPRLMAMGADLSRIRFPRVSVLDTFMLGSIDIVRRLVTEIESAALIVIDPPACFMGDIGGSRVDSHSDSDLRRLLSPIVRVAKELGTAVIFNCHINKGVGKGIPAQMRVLGSVAMVNTARAAFMITKDLEVPNQRLFAPLKMNLCQEPPTLSFTIQKVEDRDQWVLQWTGVVEISADEALNGHDEARNEQDVAEAWLIEKFRQNPVWPAKELLEYAENELGCGVTTIRNARNKLGILARKVGKTWENYTPDHWDHA